MDCVRGRSRKLYLQWRLTGAADHEGGVSNFPKGRHRGIARQSQQEVCLCVVLRDLPDHAPKAAAHAAEILTVYEVCVPPKTVGRMVNGEKHARCILARCRSSLNVSRYLLEDSVHEPLFGMHSAWKKTFPCTGFPRGVRDKKMGGKTTNTTPRLGESNHHPLETGSRLHPFLSWWERPTSPSLAAELGHPGLLQWEVFLAVFVSRRQS